MKKLLSVFLSVIMVVSMTACAPKEEPTKETGNVANVEAKFKAGTYTGTAEGRNGEIKVDVVLSENAIESVTIIEHKETPVLSDVALKNIPEAIVNGQSLAVDIIAGATYSSKGIIEAVKSAIQSSGADVSTLYEKVEAVKVKPLINATYDVVVVGAGGAGLSAAIEAQAAGSKVLLMEKMPFAGGNTVLSGVEFAVPNNWEQEKYPEIYSVDSPDLMANDMYVAGYKLGEMDVIKAVTYGALDTAKWLRDYIGVKFYPDYLGSDGGHSVKRSILVEGRGPGLIQPLVDKATELGVEILYNTQAKELVKNESGRITGVIAENNGTEVTFTATKGVILSTGGFGANVEMREKYNTRWATLDKSVPTSNAPSITGDGIVMAEKIGANLRDMEYIQLYPFSNPVTGVFYNIGAVRWSDNAIFINKEGKRFANEMGIRDELAKAMFEQTDGQVYMLFNQETVDRQHLEEKFADDFEIHYKQGVLVKADTIEECANFFGVDPQFAKQTMDNYNQMVQAGPDTEFGRDSNYGTMLEGPWYMASGRPSVHHVGGGIEIDKDTHVLDKNGEIIPGLFAAGETTSGIHGGNRVGSCAMPEITVMGRIAGKAASAN